MHTHTHTTPRLTRLPSPLTSQIDTGGARGPAAAPAAVALPAAAPAALPAAAPAALPAAAAPAAAPSASSSRAAAASLLPAEPAAAAGDDEGTHSLLRNSPPAVATEEREAEHRRQVAKLRRDEEKEARAAHALEKPPSESRCIGMAALAGADEGAGRTRSGSAARIISGQSHAAACARMEQANEREAGCMGSAPPLPASLDGMLGSDDMALRLAAEPANVNSDDNDDDYANNTETAADDELVGAMEGVGEKFVMRKLMGNYARWNPETSEFEWKVNWDGWGHSFDEWVVLEQFDPVDGKYKMVNKFQANCEASMKENESTMRKLAAGVSHAAFRVATQFRIKSDTHNCGRKEQMVEKGKEKGKGKKRKANLKPVVSNTTGSEKFSESDGSFSGNKRTGKVSMSALEWELFAREAGVYTVHISPTVLQFYCLKDVLPLLEAHRPTSRKDLGGCWSGAAGEPMTTYTIGGQALVGPLHGVRETVILAWRMEKAAAKVPAAAAAAPSPPSSAQRRQMARRAGQDADTGPSAAETAAAADAAAAAVGDGGGAAPEPGVLGSVPGPVSVPGPGSGFEGCDKCGQLLPKVTLP